MMPSLALLLTIAVFCLTLIDAPLQSGGWLWDTSNAMGFLAFGGLLYLFLDVGSGRRQRVHQLVSYMVVASLVNHILLMLVPDPTLWRYVGLDAPVYMHMGLIAFGLCLAMIVLALPQRRRFWHLSYPQFQRWHYWLSVSVIIASGWHILGSGFYLSTLEAWLLAALVAATFAAHRMSSLPRPQAWRSLTIPPLAALAFVCLKGLAS